MSKKQQIPNTSLSGRNIYTDKKKRVIYYDSLTKQGYLVDKKSEGPIMFYQNRLVIILFAAILCAGNDCRRGAVCRGRGVLSQKAIQKP